MENRDYGLFIVGAVGGVALSALAAAGVISSRADKSVSSNQAIMTATLAEQIRQNQAVQTATLAEIAVSPSKLNIDETGTYYFRGGIVGLKERCYIVKDGKAVSNTCYQK